MANQRKRAAETKRQVAIDRMVKEVATFSENAVAGIDHTMSVKSRAIEARRILFFVSYDLKDVRLAKKLLEKLQLEFQVSNHYDYETWDTSRILVGEHRVKAIQDALDKADFGLLLLSAAWLTTFESAGDLRIFVEDDGKPVIPVVLKNIDEARYNLHGLEARQLFRLETQRGTLKSFTACRSEEERERFALELACCIEQRLQAWRAAPQSESQPYQRQLSRRTLEELRERDTHLWEHLIQAYISLPEKLVRARAQETSFRDRLDGHSGKQNNASSVVALDALYAWVHDPLGTPYCALLGEYGMGKTTTLQQLTATLLAQRRRDEQVPLPIFIDLRLFSPSVHNKEVPPLETLLQELLAQAWKGFYRPAFTAQDVLRLVREEGAILIFDGLDEKLVHLDETQGRAFLRTLWHALPPAARRQEKENTSHRRGRLIFSCRSHYFKTIREQNAMMRGEDRDGMHAADYRAWVLLPFDEGEIYTYLSSVLGSDARAKAALNLLASIHNLRELAQRPYLLSLIATHISELEHRKIRGEVVRGVTLYDLMIDNWLERDGGKHQWRPEDKERLMEEIAAAMWQKGTQEWPWSQVLEWLGNCLAQEKVWRTRYARVAPVLLEEDFRTATFVLRPHTSMESFRFAHTSLQEYFLARFLLRALLDNTPQRLALPQLSPETLDFLGQLLATAEPPQQLAALRSLEALLSDYQPQATDIALRYWLHAIAKEFPVPVPERVDLHGANLSALLLRGRSSAQPLRLVEANLAGTYLGGVHFEHVDLSGADLTRARAEQAEFRHVIAHDLTVTNADFTATTWRHCKARGWKGGVSATWDDCSWFDCEIEPGIYPDHTTFRYTLTTQGESTKLNL